MKTSIKHTPGPWEAHKNEGTGTLPCVLSNKVTRTGGFYVARCNNFGDAVLIAAAPELLEACKLVAATFKRSNDSGNFLGDDEHEAWNKVDKAIAKAEGVPCHE